MRDSGLGSLGLAGFTVWGVEVRLGSCWLSTASCRDKADLHGSGTVLVRKLGSGTSCALSRRTPIRMLEPQAYFPSLQSLPSL